MRLCTRYPCRYQLSWRHLYPLSWRHLLAMGLREYAHVNLQPVAAGH
jgi:hypothetical protein